MPQANHEYGAETGRNFVKTDSLPASLPPGNLLGRSWYKPSEMDDKDGLCQEAIERILERMGRGTNDGWVQWGGREGAKRKGNLSRHGAARVVRIFKGMVEFGMVEEEKETVDDDGKPTTGKAKTKTGRVRLKRD